MLTRGGAIFVDIVIPFWKMSTEADQAHERLVLVQILFLGNLLVVFWMLAALEVREEHVPVVSDLLAHRDL